MKLFSAIKFCFHEEETPTQIRYKGKHALNKHLNLFKLEILSYAMLLFSKRFWCRNPKNNFNASFKLYVVYFIDYSTLFNLIVTYKVLLQITLKSPSLYCYYYQKYN